MVPSILLSEVLEDGFGFWHLCLLSFSLLNVSRMMPSTLLSEASPDPLIALRFIRTNAVRMVIGAVLLPTVYWAVSVYSTYQRERRIAREIEAHGGEVRFWFVGPDWVPKPIQDILPIFDRIWRIESVSNPDEMVLVKMGLLANLTDLNLDNSQATEAGLEHLKRLTKLQRLDLCNMQITDSGLEHLKKLTNLADLNLVNTQVTDAGLKHLKGMASLNNLHLHQSETTAEGRELLRRALPNCKITPNP